MYVRLADLLGFKNVFRTFLARLQPCNINLMSDLRTKVNEFANMTGKLRNKMAYKYKYIRKILSVGAQEFISLGALFGQYIQMYSIWKQQYDIQVVTLNKMAAGPVGTGVNIGERLNYILICLSYLYNVRFTTVFNTNDFAEFVKSLETFSVGNSLALQGIIQTINAVQNAWSCPSFYAANDTLLMSYPNAQAIYTALGQITAGNSKSVQAADDLVVVANRTMYYQNNPKGIYQPSI